MATSLSTTTLLSYRRNPQHMYIQPCSVKNEVSRTVHASVSKDSLSINEESDKCSSLLVNRRAVLASGVSLLGFPGVSLAVVKQGLLAGRIPGLSEPDEQGSLTLHHQNLYFPYILNSATFSRLLHIWFKGSNFEIIMGYLTGCLGIELMQQVKKCNKKIGNLGATCFLKVL
jgi:hypothetical protein